MTDDAAKPLIPGWGWPLIVVGLLGLNIAVCAITVVYAVSTPEGVEPDYYTRALGWDEDRATFADPDTLGWTVKASAAGGAISVIVIDLDGKPVEVTSATGVCFHEAHADQRLPLTFDCPGGGLLLARADMSRPGLWEVRVEVTTPETRARIVRQVEVAGS
ncbi:MAG: FixH family protein [Phycisphaeraceae bacterium]|nr:MAG: FixH family protein [Phycisphaeraceae bacterium]